MESVLLMLFISLALATVLSIVLKKIAVSHIIAYIITGVVISNYFDFNGHEENDALTIIAEYGIVFLMFTIGLEMSFSKLKKMRTFIFTNGFLQVALSTLLIFLITKFIFSFDSITSIIVALAFSLSSTAIVMSYLKKSNDIVTPYGERTAAILIFQDLAVIPVLLLLQFLAHDDLSIGDVLLKTLLSAAAVIVFMFTIGKKITGWLLKFSAHARLEELFLGSVLSIVIGASLLAHFMGFSYSLGAFIAGMIIAETPYHVKVEADISSYRDILLGTFFFSIGTHINILYFASNLHWVLLVLMGILVIKGLVVYFLIKAKSNLSDSIKSGLALSTIGEFSFAVFSIASKNSLIDENTSNFLILVTVLSMILSPFIVNNIYKLASYVVVEFYEADKITPIDATNHIVLCGYGDIGRIVATQLETKGKRFVIISNNLTHVLLAREHGYLAYFGNIDKTPVLESLQVDKASAVVIAMNSIKTKRVICETILEYNSNIPVIIRVNTQKEKSQLDDLPIRTFVHAQNEIANLLVQESLKIS